MLSTNRVRRIFISRLQYSDESFLFCLQRNVILMIGSFFLSCTRVGEKPIWLGLVYSLLSDSIRLGTTSDDILYLDMSVRSDSSCLLRLPVEILHHILDYIDVFTITLSLANVCEHLRAIVQSYNRYELDFSSICKSNFDRIVRLIEPETVLSLILSDENRTPGQIRLFFSSFEMSQFTRLVSLSLLGIAEHELTSMLSSDLPRTLRSLNITWRETHRPTPQTLELLSVVLIRLNLQQLQLNSDSYAMEEMPWPVQQTLQHLTLMYITHEHLCLLLEQIPHLQTLVLSHCSMHQTKENVDNTPLSTRLKSCALLESRMSMEELQSILYLIPSLTDLKLICSADSFETIADGLLWEECLRKNLPRLARFEFFFTNLFNVYYDARDIDLLISRFQSSFWLEEKHWLVTCDYIGYLNQVMLYTIPICTTDFTYECQANRISYSNATISDDQSSIANGVRTLNLTLTKLKFPAETSRVVHSTCERKTTGDYLFPHVTKLTIDVDQDWSTDSIQSLSSIIDLSKLETFTFNPDLNSPCIANTRQSMEILLALAFQLRSLAIHPYFADQDESVAMSCLCSMVPNHIEYLEVSVKNVAQMKLIFDAHHDHLTSLTFFASGDQSIPWSDFITLLHESKKDFTWWESYYSLRLWFSREMRDKTFSFSKQLLTRND